MVFPVLIFPGRCLHHSGKSEHTPWKFRTSTPFLGFTDTQLRPQEDFNLPDRFSLGLVGFLRTCLFLTLLIRPLDQLGGSSHNRGPFLFYSETLDCLALFAIANGTFQQ
jgi:hypothetical protein